MINEHGVSLTSTETLPDGTRWNNPVPLCDNCADAIDEQWPGRTQFLTAQEFNEYLRDSPDIVITPSGVVICSCGDEVVALRKEWVMV